jgi:hypothetical protein
VWDLFSVVFVVLLALVLPALSKQFGSSFALSFQLLIHFFPLFQDGHGFMGAMHSIRLVSFEKSTKKKHATHSCCFSLLVVVVDFCFCCQESMEPKEKAQQAQLLVRDMAAAHGLLLMELFGSLVVMDMITPLLQMVRNCFFHFFLFLC